MFSATKVVTVKYAAVPMAPTNMSTPMAITMNLAVCILGDDFVVVPDLLIRAPVSTGTDSRFSSGTSDGSPLFDLPSDTFHPSVRATAAVEVPRPMASSIDSTA